MILRKKSQDPVISPIHGFLRHVSLNPFIFEFKYKSTNNHFSFNVRINLLSIPSDNTFFGFCLNIDTKFCLTSGQDHGHELTS